MSLKHADLNLKFEFFGEKKKRKKKSAIERHSVCVYKVIRTPMESLNKIVKKKNENM